MVDRGNNRVNVFSSAGNFRFAWGWGVADGITTALQRCGPEATPPTVACFAGLLGAGAGQFEAPSNIAVDNSGGPSDGDVYVGTDNYRVQKFDSEGHFLLSFGSKGTGDGQFSLNYEPIEVDPSGTVYVCDSVAKGSSELEGFDGRVEKFDPSGAFIESVPITIDSVCFHLAIDSGGDLYTTTNHAQLHKYDPTGNLLFALDPGTSAFGIGVDATDHLFVSQAPVDSPYVITEYDSSGTKLSRFGYGEIQGSPLQVLSVQNANGTLFGTVFGGVLHFTPPPLGPLIVPQGVIADPVGNAKATLNAQVNPEGKATTYHFEYLTDAQYQANGNSFGAGTTSTPESASVGVNFDLYSALATIGCPDPLTEAGQSGSTCLTPETKYRFRVVVKDSEGHETTVEGAPFTALPPLEVLTTFATEVGTDSAIVHAEVNPLGIPATGRFEYVEDAKFQVTGFAEAKVTASFDFGAGEAPVARSALLAGLALGTTYHYRMVADDALIEPFAGPERAFTTQAPPPSPPSPDPCPNAEFRTGASASLPDCRAYELVSPVDKDGGDILPNLNASAYPAQLNQSAIAGGKLTYSSYRAFGDAQSAPYTSQYLATRDPEAGWQSRSISPLRGTSITGIRYSLDSEFKAFSPDLCKGWLVHDTDPPLAPGAVEGFANLYGGDLCGEEGYEALSTVEPPDRIPEGFILEPQGSSADGATVIYRATDALSANAPHLFETTFLLYAAKGSGKPRLVCVLPGGAAVGTSGCSAGTATQYSQGESRDTTLTHAISDDGTRVFWSAADKGSAPLYVRENPLGSGAECSKETAPCTVAVSGSVASQSAQFWTAAADGSKALFTVIQGPLQNNLYIFDVEAKAPTLIAHQVDGVLGASEDASRIYFVSKEALSAGPNPEGQSAVAGKPNIYLYEAAEGAPPSFTFIATLTAQSLTTPSAIVANPKQHLARVSPDGRHLAFMSSAALLGYDNTDANNGEADNEVYVYESGEQLRCVSCNPTGARPVGREILEGGHKIIEGNDETGLWEAAWILAPENQFYAPRVLSEDGSRLFFDSSDALVARDTNGRQDVYEWQRAASEADCDEAGAELYVPRSGGCLSLISSGQSPQDSSFVDASADGSEVFIATGASLLPQDPGLIDIYVARVNGGFPPKPPPPPACEGEACQGPAIPPDDPTPASSSFEGAGNVTEAPKTSCRKPKVRRKGRCVAKSRKRAQHRAAKHNRRDAR